MGYEIHITRRRDWADPTNENSIAEEEFKQLIACDSQLEFREDCFSTLKDGTRRYLAFLVGNIEKADSYVDADENGLVPPLWNWLDWNDGTLDSKYPSTNMIRKMIEIANRLNAMVQAMTAKSTFSTTGTNSTTANPNRRVGPTHNQPERLVASATADGTNSVGPTHNQPERPTISAPNTLCA